MDVQDFANQATEDGIYLRAGDRAIKLPLTIDETTSPPSVVAGPGEPSHLGFANEDAARTCATILLGTAVNALLPPELRARLQQHAEKAIIEG